MIQKIACVAATGTLQSFSADALNVLPAPPPSEALFDYFSETLQPHNILEKIPWKLWAFPMKRI